MTLAKSPKLSESCVHAVLNSNDYNCSSYLLGYISLMKSSSRAKRGPRQLTLERRFSHLRSTCIWNFFKSEYYCATQSKVMKPVDAELYLEEPLI